MRKNIENYEKIYKIERQLVFANGFPTCNEFSVMQGIEVLLQDRLHTEQVCRQVLRVIQKLF